MKNNYRKNISIGVIVSFILSGLAIPPVHAGEMVMPIMPRPGTMVSLSPNFMPAHLKGMSIHPNNALQFDFLINKGQGQLDSEQKKEEYQKLIKYFLASLTIPEKDQWVNLSPYEKGRIIENNFGKTEMGRDLLSQDYLLKQITSSLMYPESGLGKTFWDRVYERAYNELGSTNIPVNTFNKVWIVPDDALVYESGNTAYILKSHLKVMLEEDYLSLEKHSASVVATPNQTHGPASKVIKEIILPELEKEVNEGKNFAQLRQIFSGMILAAWYKNALRESLLGKVYADKAKVMGVDQDPASNEKIYQQYLAAFKKGVYNYIKEDTDKYTNQVIPRKYFAGGFDPRVSRAMTVVNANNLSSPAMNATQVMEYVTQARNFVNQVGFVEAATAELRSTFDRFIPSTTPEIKSGQKMVLDGSPVTIANVDQPFYVKTRLTQKADEGATGSVETTTSIVPRSNGSFDVFSHVIGREDIYLSTITPTQSYRSVNLGYELTSKNGRLEIASTKDNREVGVTTNADERFMNLKSVSNPAMGTENNDPDLLKQFKNDDRGIDRLGRDSVVTTDKKSNLYKTVVSMPELSSDEMSSLGQGDTRIRIAILTKSGQFLAAIHPLMGERQGFYLIRGNPFNTSMDTFDAEAKVVGSSDNQLMAKIGKDYMYQVSIKRNGKKFDVTSDIPEFKLVVGHDKKEITSSTYEVPSRQQKRMYEDTENVFRLYESATNPLMQKENNQRFVAEVKKAFTISVGNVIRSYIHDEFLKNHNFKIDKNDLVLKIRLEFAKHRGVVESMDKTDNGQMLFIAKVAQEMAKESERYVRQLEYDFKEKYNKALRKQVGRVKVLDEGVIRVTAPHKASASRKAADYRIEKNDGYSSILIKELVRVGTDENNKGIYASEFVEIAKIDHTSLIPVEVPLGDGKINIRVHKEASGYVDHVIRLEGDKMEFDTIDSAMNAITGAVAGLALAVGAHFASTEYLEPILKKQVIKKEMSQQQPTTDRITSDPKDFKKGGIDLNAANLNMQIKRDGRGVPLPLNMQDMNMLNSIEGFIPTIIEIKPINALPLLTELEEKIKSAPDAIASAS